MLSSTLSILFTTTIIGVFTCWSCSMIYRSPAPINVVASTIQRTTSTSSSVLSATLSMYSPSLFFALLIPGVSRKMICPLSLVYTVCILFLVVCALLLVIAIFCPISLFISVDFPTFGLPMMDTKPDLYSLFIYLLHPACAS